ncbi:DUF397 domain-containing protein [Amycolatopsis antarctica]|uniref:DUF397 domain-containing protein n=1 Tax=Amycolatopsis antarctica TaxID=1854586 RepID=A0A263CZ62_9PSEU|nr:DUF397 domain-containing protein [Amycolatopsis antarctica]OZM71452.1 DUF397 domain-containing protein [Amycolatopsis antarctica]
MTPHHTWRKSSHSGAQNNCVELAVTPAETAIRDTKDRAGGTLTLPTTAFTALLTTLRP